MNKTKIVATIGPASAKKEVLEKMIDEGLNVARINFSHGTHEEKKEQFKMLRDIAEEKGANLAILADLQGPKIRIGDIEDGKKEFLTDEEIAFSVEGKDGSVPLPHPEFIESLVVGDRLIIGDGELQFEVSRKEGDCVYARAKTRGVLVSRRGIHSTGSTARVSSITKKDIADLDLICELGFDYVAISFVRSTEDIIELKTLLKERDSTIPIVAKIEKRQAVDIIEDIVGVVDAVMVARGDLAIDTSTHEVPLFQKKIIRECVSRAVPVITATQMLQSMIENPTPTRAEASDVANAILDGTDAVMLSNETAVGAYPVESVRTMREIAEKVEEEYRHDRFANEGNSKERVKDHVANAICMAAHKITEQIDARAIVTMSESGYTTLRTARLRPHTELFTVTPNEETKRKLALVWGVQAYLVPNVGAIEDVFDHLEKLTKVLPFESGDKIVVTAGVPFGKVGTTNLVRVYEF